MRLNLKRWWTKAAETMITVQRPSVISLLSRRPSVKLILHQQHQRLVPRPFTINSGMCFVTCCSVCHMGIIACFITFNVERHLTQRKNQYVQKRASTTTHCHNAEQSGQLQIKVGMWWSTVVATCAKQSQRRVFLLSLHAGGGRGGALLDSSLFVSVLWLDRGM